MNRNQALTVKLWRFRLWRSYGDEEDSAEQENGDADASSYTTSVLKKSQVVNVLKFIETFISILINLR